MDSIFGNITESDSITSDVTPIKTTDANETTVQTMTATSTQTAMPHSTVPASVKQSLNMLWQKGSIMENWPVIILVVAFIAIVAYVLVKRK